MLLPCTLLLMSFGSGNDSLPPQDSSKIKKQVAAGEPSKQFKSLLPQNNGPAPSSATRFEIAPNTQVVGFKEAYISRENREMERMRSWGKPYFAIYDRILAKYNLPVELKYLSVIESSLISSMRSHAGAVGPWQLMYDEAMRFGLRVNERGDERTDYYKSTDAAAQLLKELYARFGDWLLVIAAYNAGSGAVNRAITESGSSDFWKLQYHLPQETRNHVKKYISTHYYFEGNGGITTMTKQEAYHFQQLAHQDSRLSAQELRGTETLLLRGFFNVKTICEFLSYPQQKFERYNPGFDREISAGKDYELRLPVDQMLLFKEKKHAILEKCFQDLLG